MRLRSSSRKTAEFSSPEKKENIPNFFCRTPSKSTTKNTASSLCQSSPRRTPQKLSSAQLNLPSTPIKRILDFDLNLSSKSPYSSVKAAFWRSVKPTSILCRDSEKNVICNFIKNFVLTKQANSLYISGNPGTGKSALINEVLHNYTQEFAAESIVFFNMNCMSFLDFPSLLASIASKVKGSSIDKKLFSTPSDLYTMLRSRKNRSKNKSGFFCLIVLDEIDFFAKTTEDQEKLYSLFELVSQPGSCLSLIGIANALDFTDRLLPRLKCRSLEPQLLHFSPYTVDQITEIISCKIANISQDSLENRNNNESQSLVITQNAIELAARKVAACGDLRKALDIIKSAISVAERENASVSIKHILKALENSFGNASKAQVIKQLSVYLQAILGCSLYPAVQNNGHEKQALFESYCNLRKSFSWLTELSFCEVDDAITALEVLGLFSIVRKYKKDARVKVCCLFTTKEFEDAIRDNALVASLNFVK